MRQRDITTDEPKERSATPEGQNKEQKPATIEEILATMARQLANGEMKVSPSDYMRMLQIQKERAAEPKTALRVTWIEEPESSER
jgi:hypothetical protein